MPHIVVKLYPGRTEEQKQNIAKKITEAVKEAANASYESISVGIEEISKDQWQDEVVKKDIIQKESTSYKKPGYLSK